MEVPETLKHRMELFRESARIYKYDKDLFSESSWTQVMMGQGIMPKSYHPIVDLMGDQELERFLEDNRMRTRQVVDQMPSHADFIKKYCPSVSMKNDSKSMEKVM
jgi:tryptophan halogenase